MVISSWPPRCSANSSSQTRLDSSWLIAPKPNFSKVSRPAFDDEGRGVLVELIGVRPDPAVLGLLEDEVEGVEALMRAVPDEMVAPRLDLGLEVAGMGGAEFGIDPVGGDDQVEVLQQRRCPGSISVSNRISTPSSRARS